VAPDVTADLSGFSQSLGYLLAALGPLAVGAAHGALGAWRPILVVLALSGVVMAVAGSLASRPGAVDDELRLPAGG
jgi:MFS transporter, CP family, cyanate transporter